VERREALIARPNVIVPVGFEMAEEGEDALETQVGQSEARDPAAAIGRDEA